MSSIRPRYIGVFNPDKVYEWLLNGRGYLSDYQKNHHPELKVKEAINHWMRCQPLDYIEKCRALYPKIKRKTDSSTWTNTLPNDKKILSKIRSQKIWRQRVDSLVILELPKGVNSK